MSEHEVRIRLIEEERAFVYSVRERGRVVDCRKIEIEEEVLPGYYGGSEVMD